MTSKIDKSPLFELPVEMIGEIAQWLRPADLAAIAQTCKCAYDLMRKPALIDIFARKIDGFFKSIDDACAYEYVFWIHFTSGNFGPLKESLFIRFVEIYADRGSANDNTGISRSYIKCALSDSERKEFHAICSMLIIFSDRAKEVAKTYSIKLNELNSSLILLNLDAFADSGFDFMQFFTCDDHDIFNVDDCYKLLSWMKWRNKFTAENRPIVEKCVKSMITENFFEIFKWVD